MKQILRRLLTLAGLMPKNGGYVSLKKTGEDSTNMYLTFGRRLGALGYYTFAGHNNSYTYYGYTGALKAPVRCFGNRLSEKRKS